MLKLYLLGIVIGLNVHFKVSNLNTAWFLDRVRNHRLNNLVEILSGV